MMTRVLPAFASVAAALLFASCANTMFIGEEHGINLAVEAKNDATEPAKFNFGFQSHTAVVVPPKVPLEGYQLLYPKFVAKGEVLSSVSRFRLVHTSTDPLAGNNVLTGPTLAIQSAVVTGSAANALFEDNKPATARALRAVRSAGRGSSFTGIGETAAAIVKSPNP